MQERKHAKTDSSVHCWLHLSVPVNLLMHTDCCQNKAVMTASLQQMQLGLALQLVFFYIVNIDPAF